MGRLLSTKSLDTMILDEERGESRLRRVLGPVHLIALGVGATLGIGVFVLTGIVSARYAGPAVLLSFLFASLACVFVGLCYAEFAALVPIAGSAYSYAYATVGELIAWIIGWDLVLEYVFGAATVAWGWSGYLDSLLRNFGIALPPSLAGSWWDEFVYYNGHWEHLPRLLPKLQAIGLDPARLPHTHGVVNLFGVLAVVCVTQVLFMGIRESARSNAVVVLVKVFALLFFIVVGAYYLLGHPSLTATNWHPFIPKNDGFGRFGWSGIARAAAFLFFAYIGFDVVATEAEESKNPQRDLPIAIMVTIAICTVLYLLFAGVLVGLVNYKDLDVADPLAIGIEQTGLHWGSLLVTLGALGSLTSTLYVLLVGASRLLFTIARDGLLPRMFLSLHLRFRTPYVSALTAGAVSAILAGLMPIDVMAEMVSIGTLLAFTIVCVGILALRRRSDLVRPFKVPLVPLVPLVGISASLVMMLSLTAMTWLRLAIWFVIGMTVYFCYGYRHSAVQRQESRAPRHEESDQADFETPEVELIGKVLRGLLTAVVIIVGVAAILGGFSIFFPTINRHFQTLALVLAIVATSMGLFGAIFPRLRALWRLRSETVSFDDEPDETVRELIQKLEGSHGSGKAKG